MNDTTVKQAAEEPGDSRPAESLLNLVYNELRRLAAHKLAQEAPGQTLQPTALVHEAWLKLAGAGEREFADRTHFFNAAAEAMRRILVDRARRRLTRRHGGGVERVAWDEEDLAALDQDDQLLAVNDALERLAREHPVQAQVVRLRYFAGLSNEEVAGLLELSATTIKNYWVFARAWLYREIQGG